jgi:hypothetical protein
MALNFKQANAAVNAAADAACALLNGGKLRIYDGAQPATADTAIDTQVLLAELTFGSPAFAGAAAGVAAANAITQDSSADATGTAAWFRALKTDLTKVYDGSVGVSGCDLNLNSVSIQAGGVVAVTSLTYTQPKSL